MSLQSGDFVYYIIPSDTKQNFEGTPTNPAWHLGPCYRVGYINGLVFVYRIKLTAKTVDENPASCKRWISRKEI